MLSSKLTLDIVTYVIACVSVSDIIPNKNIIISFDNKILKKSNFASVMSYHILHDHVKKLEKYISIHCGIVMFGNTCVSVCV